MSPDPAMSSFQLEVLATATFISLLVVPFQVYVAFTTSLEVTKLINSHVSCSDKGGLSTPLFLRPARTLFAYAACIQR